MTPYYEDSAVRIFLGDCREMIPDMAADAVVTDPPWNMGYFKDDNKQWLEYRNWLCSLKDSCEQVAIGQTWFLSTKSIPYVASLFEGYVPFASVKNFSQMTPKSLPNCWDIAFIKSSNYSGNGRNWFLSNTAGMLQERTEHPTPRGLDVMLFVIGMHKWGTILDPFMGSGTTLVAAKSLGRKAIGIEIEEKYCAIAAKRLQQEYLPLTQPIDGSKILQDEMFSEAQAQRGNKAENLSSEQGAIANRICETKTQPNAEEVIS